jgi:hypothetical protein
MLRVTFWRQTRAMLGLMKKSRELRSHLKIRENWPDKAGNRKIALMKVVTHKPTTSTTNRKTVTKLTVQIQTPMDSQSSNSQESRTPTEPDLQTTISSKVKIQRWELKGITIKSRPTLIYLQPQIHQNGSEITIISAHRIDKRCSLMKSSHSISIV